jgi:phosphatidylinositol phosphate synthase
VIKARFGDRLDSWVEAAVPFLFRRPINPNALTVAGTAVSVGAGVAFAIGWFGWGAIGILVGGVFDLVDGVIARKQGTATAFGAFLDSTLDRVADGACLSGLAMFYALSPRFHSVPMVIVCLTGLIGAYLTSYIRARAEALGLDAKVGLVQRPERSVLLAVPQALFGLLLDGWVLDLILVFLTVTAWITVMQRMKFVYEQTTSRADAPPLPLTTEKSFWLRRRGRTGTRP